MCRITDSLMAVTYTERRSAMHRATTLGRRAARSQLARNMTRCSKASSMMSRCSKGIESRYCWYRARASASSFSRRAARMRAERASGASTSKHRFRRLTSLNLPVCSHWMLNRRVAGSCDSTKHGAQ